MSCNRKTQPVKSHKRKARNGKIVKISGYKRKKKK